MKAGAIHPYIKETVLTILAVLAFSSTILLLTGAPPFSAYYHILQGAFGSWIKFSHVIRVWVPLCLCACGLLYTFRINLWNIGIEGQVMMGAVCAVAVLKTGIDAGIPHLVLGLSFIFGVAGGALWAVAAGFLKTRGGVNEIFAGLGLNFLAQGIVLYLIFGPWKRPGTASMSGTELLPRELWLSYIPSLRIAPAGLMCAVAVLVVTAVILRYTRLGLGLKAIGSNSASSFLFGLKPDRYMLIAMIFAGGCAGLAGSVQVTGVYHRLIPAISSNYGYLALLVVMLANYRVWLTPVIALFFACLNVGSIQLPMKLQIDSSLSGVIQGALVLAALAMNAWRIRTRRKETLL